MAKTVYFCKLCPYKTININHLNCHVNAVHLKLKPFKCEKCSSEFSQKSSLKLHFREYHGENAGKIHKCELCNKVLSTAPHLRKHHLVVHKESKTIHKCDMCDYQCILTGKLKLHKKQVHFKKSRKENVTFV